MVAVRPCTTRAVKTVGLVGRQQGLGALERNVLVQQRIFYAVESTPPPSRARVEGNFLFMHGRHPAERDRQMNARISAAGLTTVKFFIAMPTFNIKM